MRDAAGRTLMAYAVRPVAVRADPQRGRDLLCARRHGTPVKAALLAAAVNIAFKFLLMGPLAQVGLALATSIGAWINLGLVVWFAVRAGHMRTRRTAPPVDVEARRRRRRARGRAVVVRRAGQSIWSIRLA